MLGTAFKAFKPTFTNPAVRSALFKQTPFQAALIQRSFARGGPHVKPTHTVPTTSFHQTPPEQTFIPPQQAAPIPTGPTADQVIREDLNLSKFMSRIYRTTGLSIAGSLSLSYILATSSMTVAMSPFVTLFGGLALTIGGIVGLSKIAPIIVTEPDANGYAVEKWVNPASRQLAFSAVIAGSGIMLSPFIQGLLLTNPGVIPVAAGLSVMTMGGASLYALYKPLGQFKAWQSTLTSALFGLIGMQLVSLLLMATIGPNAFSFAASRIDMYVGLGLFTAFQAFDTQVAVQAFREGNRDHLMHVVNFFLNFKNLFIRIAQILSMWNDN